MDLNLLSVIRRSIKTNLLLAIFYDHSVLIYSHKSWSETLILWGNQRKIILLFGSLWQWKLRRVLRKKNKLYDSNEHELQNIVRTKYLGGFLYWDSVFRTKAMPFNFARLSLYEVVNCGIFNIISIIIAHGDPRLYYKYRFQPTWYVGGDSRDSKVFEGLTPHTNNLLVLIAETGVTLYTDWFFA